MLEIKTCKFISEGANHPQRISNFPLSYHVEYEQPLHGFESVMGANINQIVLPFAKQSSVKVKSQDVRA